MRSPSSVVVWTIAALAVTAGLVGIALKGLSWSVGFWPVVALWLVSVTVVTFVLYGVDKRQAERGGRRVPEATLHTLAAVGGSAGAWVAMQRFRHKTIKGKFRLVFWLIVATQLVLLVWAAKDAWGEASSR